MRPLCRMTSAKLCYGCAKLENTVQATIVSVRVTNWRKRKWPFKHDGRVSCIAKGTSKPVKPEQPEEELVLQDQVTANSSDGYLDLSRHVVSVELNGRLEVIISADKSRALKSCGRVFFPAQESKVSRRTCNLGFHTVEVTVAWSLLIRDKRYISREGCVDGQTFEHTAKIRARKHVVTTPETHSATKVVQAKIYSLLNLISESAVNLKPEPKLRISDYSLSEIKIHMDNMYTNVTSLIQMMGKVQNREILGKEPVTEKMGVKGIQIRTEDSGESAMEMQASRTYYNYGLNAIFNGLDQLCTQLDQMGHLSYKSPSFSELFKEPLDEVSLMSSSSMETKLETEEVEEMGEDANMDKGQTDEEFFARYRSGWVSNWSRFHGSFTETTSLSPMHYTHITPGQRPLAALVDSTLQIYSLKVAKIEDGSGLKWPLQVYGVVAARDSVDHNRNILFSRRRSNCQILTQEDPFLRLTGPSRAIVSREPLNVEIELKVKGTTKSEDKPLMSFFCYYSGSHCGICTLYIPLEGDFCTMALSSEEVYESVQATVVGIRVCVPEETPSLFKNGGRVVCSSLPRRRAKLPDPEHRTGPCFGKLCFKMEQRQVVHRVTLICQGMLSL
ncbi:unnamed protein product [Triticum aestivum]|uniref:DUF6598 domain-containing protein n=2 Tax=Triticum aestivum TaxID=4565 RepID=A0A9R1JHP9_WHEAT|nr:hypothetical protein CFC21_031214 [Triticum aestivum]SPT19488.1 unnamed protein product [Triticum aestivum]